MDIRKALAVTTALTAVGTVASGAALAAEKPTINLSGYYDIFLGISDQDQVAGQATTGTPVYDGGAGVNRLGMVHYGEFHVTARGTTDSGMQYRVVFEKSSDDNDGSTHVGQTSKKISTDEAYVELSGSWGALILGGQDGPADQMYEGPDDFVYTGAREHAIFADINGGVVAGADKANIEDSSDATKIYYRTPRVSGFRAGYSISPEANSTGSINDNRTDAGEGGPFHEFGLEYRGKIGDGQLSATFNYTRSELPNPVTSADDQLNAWRVSARYEQGPWAVAAGYVDNDFGTNGAIDDVHAWEVGGAYNGGKWEVGLYYLKSEAEASGGVEDEYSQWSVSGVYNLGGGMSVAATLTFFDLDAPSASEVSDGWAGVVKTSFRF